MSSSSVHVYNSYIQNSIKESQRAHRSDTTPVDIDFRVHSIMPVDSHFGPQ